MTRRQLIAMTLLAPLGFRPGMGAAQPETKAGQRNVQSKAKPGGKDNAVNINDASKTELMTLAGVGAVAAERIIAHRQAHGPFKRPQDLANVQGVGQAVLDKNAGRIVVK
jgi:competence protein ComEA